MAPETWNTSKDRKQSMRTRLRSISLALGGVLLLVSVGLPGVPRAEPLEGSFEADSEITLAEKSGAQVLTITLVTIDGKTSLTSDRSGSLRTAEVPATVCSKLWEDLLALPVDELESATPKAAYPDSSEFTLTLRVGSTSHRLTVYDVDSLEDERYRDGIRAILALERDQVSKATER
jgi:hypothetical protein